MSTTESILFLMANGLDTPQQKDLPAPFGIVEQFVNFANTPSENLQAELDALVDEEVIELVEDGYQFTESDIADKHTKRLRLRANIRRTHMRLFFKKRLGLEHLA